jgi:pyruvate,water dikinase
MVLRAAALVLSLTVGCSGGSAPMASRDGGADDGARDGGHGDDGGDQRPRFLARLETQADYERVQGEGGELKFFAAIDGKAAPAPLDGPCAFPNTERYPFHLDFLRSLPQLSSLDYDGYRALATMRESRVLWAGSLKYLPGATHPRTGAQGVLAYFLFTEPGAAETPTTDQLAALDGRLKACAPFARDLLVLVGADAEQAALFAQQGPALAGRGVDLVDYRTLKPGVGAEGYSLGMGYGFLRVVPHGQQVTDYGPRDVLVADDAPLDLGLVAGLVTALPQNLHSHVNLRLREKMIPNASVPDIQQNHVIGLLDGKLVRIVVREERVEIDAATPEAAAAFWAIARPKPVTPAADLTETRLRDLTAIGATDAVAYGTKAANLGELQKVVPPPSRVAGFAIPFSVYRDFLHAYAIDARIETLLGDPRLATDATIRREQLLLLQKIIESPPLPAGLLDRLAAAARTAFGEGYATMPIRFRSSSNTEDTPESSGAGLHDSSRGCFADDLDGDDEGPSACLAPDERAAMEAELARRRAQLEAHPEYTWLPPVIDDLQKDLTNERSVTRALRKVFASLWNDRAFEERAYQGIDHRAAFMGVAVDASFVLEKLDAVAVTQLDGGAAGPLYRVVSQRGGEGVVRPTDPTLVAETLTFHRGPGDTVTGVELVTHSSLSATPLWSEAQIAQLGALLFLVHDHFAGQVYPQVPRLSLDTEIKLTRDDRIVIKQARPYVVQATGVSP